ncbi:hypothetical protein ZHAS_00006267 [Anopheles sinensis]|uniref:Uncharacterized protein n=1 Tax=Anopheles sinensis TaxID=74873 RepID=A0A084VLU9_ANOSI|nr:hypothetical protein ZHAS_00006267 [Anopheles sinensis]
MTKRSNRKRNVTPVNPVKPTSKKEKLRQFIRCCGKGLVWLVKMLLFLVALRVMYCLHRLWPRLLHVVDLMVVGWTMMLQLMQDSGLAGDFQVLPDVMKYVSRANNRTWPLCSD